MNMFLKFLVWVNTREDWPSSTIFKLLFMSSTPGTNNQFFPNPIIRNNNTFVNIVKAHY